MQISQMMRSVFGETRPADAKTLELKAGQVVRGMVMQWLSNQDALVQIEGVQVKARLEAALAKGQSALLQVMAGSKDGALTLKLLTAMEGNSAASVDSLLLKLGMKPNDALREIALALRQAGLDVTKEQIQALRSLLDAAPPQTARAVWLQTGALALAKGLPLEPQPLAALSRAIFGPPIGQTLTELAEGVRAVLANPQPGVSQLTGGLLQELAGRLQSLLQSVPGWPAGNHAVQQAPGGTAGLAASQTTGMGPSAPATPGLSIQPPQAQPAPGGQIGTVGAATISQVQASAVHGSLVPNEVNSTSQQASSQTVLGTAANATANRLAAAPPQGSVLHAAPASVAGAQAQASAVHLSVSERAAQAAQSVQANAGGSVSSDSAQPLQASTAGGTQAPAGEQGWLPRMLKLFGFDHEHQAMRLIQSTAQDGPSMQAAQMTALMDGMEGGRTNELATLKSVLLQLSAVDDLPLSLREPIQQLLQQVTGQQLLLTPDRSGNFAHVTLFVPFFDKDGQQTAAIHIQSRKSRKGGIDADNCRLWFDLRMAALGPTLVDVQVTDKRVNVGLFNDHPALAELAEQGKALLTAALADAGFQLLSFHQSPYPHAEETRDNAVNEEQEKMQQLLERNKPYKGVDYRV